MFITLPKIQNIVTTKISDINLRDIDTKNNLLIYDLRYVISQDKFIRNNVSKIIISSYSTPWPIQQITRPMTEKSPSDTISKFISVKKSSQRDRETNDLISRVISIASLNIDENTKKKMLQDENYKITKNKFLLKRVTTIQSNSLLAPILSTNKNNETDDVVFDKQQRSFDLLYSGHDPANIIYQNNDNDSISNNTSGTSRVATVDSNSQEATTTFDLLINDVLKIPEQNKFINDLEEDNLVIVKEDVDDNSFVVTETFAIPYDKLKFQKFYITIELLDERNIPIDSFRLVKNNVDKDIEIFTTPKTALSIKCSKANKTQLNFLISNIDQNTQTIAVYRKELNKFNPNQSSSIYQSVANINVKMIQGLSKMHEYINYAIQNASTNVSIYRFVQIGFNGVKSSDFGTYVYTPKNPKQLVSGISTVNLLEGVEVTLTGLPIGVASYCVLRRNLTKKQRMYQQISKYYVKGEINSYFVDTNALENNIYQYTHKFIGNRSASTISTNTSIHEFIKPNGKLRMNLRVSQPSITHPDSHETYDVSFSITAELNPSTLNVVYSRLINDGIEDFFANDVAERREQLDEIVAFKVFRQSTTSRTMTNDRVEFDLLLTDDFNDNEQSLKTGVSFPVVGQNYKYTVVPYLRFTEEILQQLSNNKAKPLFKHDNIKYGNISTPNTITKLYASDPFAFGQLGVEKSVLTGYNKSSSQLISQQSAMQYDLDTIILSWTLSNAVGNDIDHFLIFRIDCFEKRTLIGRSHAHQDSVVFNYIHNISTNDIGTVKYAIRAVYHDYSNYHEVETNSLEIG